MLEEECERAAHRGGGQAVIEDGGRVERWRRRASRASTRGCSPCCSEALLVDAIGITMRSKRLNSNAAAGGDVLHPSNLAMRRPRKSKLLRRRTRPYGGVKTDEVAQEQAPVEANQTSRVKTDEAVKEQAPVEADQTSVVRPTRRCKSKLLSRRTRLPSQD